jgi:hypothetical protein
VLKNAVQAGYAGKAHALTRMLNEGAEAWFASALFTFLGTQAIARIFDSPALNFYAHQLVPRPTVEQCFMANNAVLGVGAELPCRAN